MSVRVYTLILGSEPPKKHEDCVGPQLVSKILGKGSTWWRLLPGPVFISCRLKLVLLVTSFIHRLW